MSRTKGAKNRHPDGTHGAAAHIVPGSATSACKMNRRVGVVENFSMAWYERGRAVTWQEVVESVREGYNHARWRAAQRGRRWLDGFERVQANIAEAMANKGHHA